MVTSKDNGFNYTEQKIFSQLLWADTLRGDDSTGVFGVNEYGNLDYIKNKGHAGELIQTKEYSDFETGIFRDYHMVVGHNRKATKGWVSDENAHPFVEGTIALVHNGTLTNHASLTDEIVSVDSHAILHSIVEKGYIDTLKEIQGAFTLAWYDTNDKTLRLIRNDQRPLFIASTVGAWFFASERGMLEWILGREQTTISEMEECTPGTLYSFKLEDKKNMWFQPVDIYEPPPFKHTPYVAPVKPLKTGEEETKKETDYKNSDFVIGTKILIQGNRLQKLDKENQEGYTHLFYGKWYVDENILVKCWATDDEIETLESSIDDTITDSDIVFQAEIMCVMSKKNRITLICRKISPYIPVLDSSGKEIYEDEYMFTDKTCSYCTKEMGFTEASLGIFKFASADDHEIICEHCLSEGKHLLI